MDPFDTTQAFLQRYFADLAADEAIEIRSIRRDPHKSHSNFGTDLETLATGAHTRNEAGFDSYFGAASRRAGKHDGSAENVARARWLWADLDFKGYEHGEEGAKAAARSLGLGPQIAIRSGGGLQFFWRLTEPLEDQPTVKNLLRRLATALESDRAVADVARVMRLPGTVNHKYDHRPLVTVAYYDQYQPYGAGYLDTYLPALPEPAVATPAYDGPGGTLQDLDEALRYISPDKPSLDYVGWVKILMGIYDAEPGPEGLALAEHWGRGKPGEIARKWRTFERGAVTVGSVFWEAQQRGYVRPRPTPGPVITGPRSSPPGEPVKARPAGDGARLIYLDEFLADPPPPVEWCVDDLLPRTGTSLVVAPPKVGKSFFSINIGLAVASGSPILGRATTQGRAAFISLDMPKGPLWYQIERLLPAYRPEQGQWGFQSKWDDQQLKARPWERIEEIIAAERPAFVIIDTLQKAMKIPETNDYAVVEEALTRASDLAEAYNTHVMLIHHSNKLGGTMGSQAFDAAVDQILRLVPDLEIGGIRLEFMPRWTAPIAPAAIYMDDHIRQLHLIDDNRDKAALHAVGQQILAYLSTCAGREAPERDLRGALLSEAGTVSKALGALDAAHRISRADGKVKLFAWMPTAHRTEEHQMELETGD